MNKTLIRLKLYKLFGFILTIMSLPFTLIVLARDPGPPHGEPEPLWLAIPLSLFAFMGLYIFIAVDHVLKHYEKAGKPVPEDLTVPFDKRALKVAIFILAFLIAITLLLFYPR